MQKTRQSEDIKRANNSKIAASITQDTVASGLSVDQNSQATNLGQLNDNNSQQKNTTSTSPKKTIDPFDPTTFAQYEKYKDAKGGLFADVQKGNGEEMAAGKKGVVLYKGWLTDGQLFDQSKPNASGQMQAFSFTLGAHEVIPGWEQSINGMKAGGVRLFIIPPALGYGEAGQGPVPPNSVLIFKVELITVQ